MKKCTRDRIEAATQYVAKKAASPDGDRICEGPPAENQAGVQNIVCHYIITMPFQAYSMLVPDNPRRMPIPVTAQQKCSTAIQRNGELTTSIT
jgi:hypothetical protein